MKKRYENTPTEEQIMSYVCTICAIKLHRTSVNINELDELYNSNPEIHSIIDDIIG